MHHLAHVEVNQAPTLAAEVVVTLSVGRTSQRDLPERRSHATVGGKKREGEAAGRRTPPSTQHLVSRMELAYAFVRTRLGLKRSEIQVGLEQAVDEQGMVVLDSIEIERRHTEMLDAHECQRAAPRLLMTTFLLLVGVSGRTSWLQAVAAVLFVFSLPRLATRRWWHYVRTGVPLEEPVDPHYRESGVYRVELLGLGPNYIEVVKALREGRALTLVEAKQLSDSLPATVAEELSESSANAMAERIARAGGRPRVAGAGSTV